MERTNRFVGSRYLVSAGKVDTHDAAEFAHWREMG